VLDWGREICGEIDTAERREWLCTNGLGGFASGTIAGTLTRRYHGLLVAALTPPLGRTLVVAKLEENVAYDGGTWALGANRWADGTLAPHGFRDLERFRLDGTTPVWTYACGDALLEKRVWMEPGANTTYVRYAVMRASAPVALSLRVLVNHRDTDVGGQHGGVGRIGDPTQQLGHAEGRPVARHGDVGHHRDEEATGLVPAGCAAHDDPALAAREGVAAQPERLGGDGEVADDEAGLDAVGVDHLPAFEIADVDRVAVGEEPVVDERLQGTGVEACVPEVVAVWSVQVEQQC